MNSLNCSVAPDVSVIRSAATGSRASINWPITLDGATVITFATMWRCLRTNWPGLETFWPNWKPFCAPRPFSPLISFGFRPVESRISAFLPCLQAPLPTLWRNMTEPDAIVFVVDDDPSVRRSTERLLRSAGLKVQTYSSAREFRDSHRPSGPPCLVLDMLMPGSGGMD